MAKNKVKGFLTAVLVAIISFFIIFFLLPGVASRYLGVSMKEPESRKGVQQVAEKVVEKTEQTVSTVSDGIQNLINNSNGN